MKNLIRNLTLSAAALAALGLAPVASAQSHRDGRQGGGREQRSDNRGDNRRDSNRGRELNRGGDSNRGRDLNRGRDSNRGRDFDRRGDGNRFRDFGNRRDFGYQRGYSRSYSYYSPRFYAPHRYIPFRVLRGVSYYDECPGPDYIYTDDGWALPPWEGALWIPGHFDRFGIRIGGTWR